MPGAEAQIIGGHKANIHNPNTSLEAKDHSRDVLKDEYNSMLNSRDYLIPRRRYGYCRLTQ